MNVQEAKSFLLGKTASAVRAAYPAPRMTQLFLEVTSRCNMRCVHCGSSCTGTGSELSLDQIRQVLQEFCNDAEYSRQKPFVILTGGEPMMRSDLKQIAELLHKMQFHWGMTTNGTLITEENAHWLSALGLASVAISLDGPPEYHDRFRGQTGAYDAAMRGLQCLIQENDHICKSITTVVTRQNLPFLSTMYHMWCDLSIDNWRLLGVEPIGRALDHPEMMLQPEEYRQLMQFIQEKRFANQPVEYSCPHYLGFEFEGEVRDWFFHCLAGIEVCSVMSDGSIGACLDIERTAKTIQGNICQDALLDVWRNRFEVFRQDLSDHTEGCKSCPHADACRGGSHHTYDHEKHEQRFCMKGVLFD